MRTFGSRCFAATARSAQTDSAVVDTRPEVAVRDEGLGRNSTSGLAGRVFDRNKGSKECSAQIASDGPQCATVGGPWLAFRFGLCRRRYVERWPIDVRRLVLTYLTTALATPAAPQFGVEAG